MILETTALAAALVCSVWIWSRYRLSRTRAKLAKVDEGIVSRITACEAAHTALTSSIALTDGRVDVIGQRVDKQEDKLNGFVTASAFKRH